MKAEGKQGIPLVSRGTGVKLFFLGLFMLIIAWGLNRAGQSSFVFFIVIGAFMALGGFLYALHPDDENAETEEYESSTETKYESKPEEHQRVEVAQPQVMREVIKEKETIREIVKIRCRHCGELFEERKTRCPYCNAPA